MRMFKTALQRIWPWLSPAKSAQLAPTAINPAPAKPGIRERAILHAIRVLHNNAYGVTIQEELERAKMDLSFTAINDCLNWMESKELVEWRMGEPSESSAKRRTWKKLYTLTPKGEEALRG
jgi:DNA-binding PadR family transcriptional regulator